MENEIKKFIQLWNEEYCKKGNVGLRKDQVMILKFLENLQSLLEFKQKNCCGSILDKLADAYAEGYQQCKEDLEGPLRISLVPEIINSQGIEKIHDKYGNEL